MAYVVVRDPHNKVISKADLKTAVTIGRAPECDLRVRDGRVSREHCLLEPCGDGWRVKDLGSANRTFVNGRAVEQTRVMADGDTIELGDHRLCFYAGKLGRNRTADPVMAGLVDVERTASQGEPSTFPSDGRSESSLFATRVIIDAISAGDDSTILGTPSVGELQIPKPAAAARPQPRQPARRSRLPIITAAAVGVTLLTIAAIWAWLN